MRVGIATIDLSLDSSNALPQECLKKRTQHAMAYCSLSDYVLLITRMHVLDLRVNHV